MNKGFMYLCIWLLSLTHAGAELESAFRRELASLQSEFGFPGATAAFVLPTGAFGEVAIGYSDVEHQQAMTPQSRMLAASIGKTYVSACTLALAAENVINLDTPIAEWIGDRTWFSRLPHGDRITIRHLLMHRSGLADHVHTERFQAALQARWQEKQTMQPETLIDFILDTPVRSVPGETWQYSDTGYVILGLILKQACGHSLYEEVENRFLAPLHLTNTIPSNRRELPGLATGYTSPDNPFGFPVKSIDKNGRMRWHPGVENFGGGWMTTAGDLARWGAALYTGHALPATASTEILQTLLPMDPDAPSARYGLGVSHSTDGPLGPSYGHGGWIPGYVSSLRYYSKYAITVAFQINSDHIDSEANWLQEMEVRLARVLLQEQHNTESSNHE